MIDPFVHIVFLLSTILISNFIKYKDIPTLFAVVGVIFLSLFSPTSSIFLLLCVAQASIIVKICKDKPKSSKVRKYLPYILLLNLLFVDFHQLLLGFFMKTIGISFSIIRIFMTSKELITEKDTSIDRNKWLFISSFYLPAIIIGPVFSALSLQKQTTNPPKDLGTTSFLYRNLCFGWFLAVVALPMVAYYHSSISPDSAISIIATVFLSFFVLFFSFWGQSLIAEMGSKIAGYSIPANFDKPWLAKDIRDFWRRWHISMSQFVTNYIYIPLILKGYSPKISAIIAFLAMGLWHKVGIGYAIWGIFHGLLMAYCPKDTSNESKLVSRIRQTLTIVSVLSLSYIANRGFS